MKHELTHAFSLVIVAGTSKLLERIPTVWKAVIALALAFSAGTVAATTLWEQRELPTRVTALESKASADSAYFDGRLDAITGRVTANEDNARTQNMLLLRVICRLDGNSANSCDLRYGGGMRIEP